MLTLLFCCKWRMEEIRSSRGGQEWYIRHLFVHLHLGRGSSHDHMVSRVHTGLLSSSTMIWPSSWVGHFMIEPICNCWAHHPHVYCTVVNFTMSEKPQAAAASLLCMSFLSSHGGGSYTLSLHCLNLVDSPAAGMFLWSGSIRAQSFKLHHGMNAFASWPLLTYCPAFSSISQLSCAVRAYKGNDIRVICKSYDRDPCHLLQCLMQWDDI